MSRRKKNNHRTEQRPSGKNAPKKFSAPWLVSGLALLAIAAGVLVYLHWGRKDPQAAREKNASGSLSPVSVRPDDFIDLIGHWRRKDGGYRLEIRKVGSDGRVTAAYYNPKSINVARAEALLKKAEQHVYIEFQDVGYPGSAYALVYQPNGDILVDTISKQP